MKNRLKLLTIAVVLAAPVAILAAEADWFDIENCSMCKNMSSEEGLLEHIDWETFVIENGMLTVTQVDPAYVEAFEKAHKKMEKTGEKLMAGEQMYLCNFCQSYGAIHMAGATFENIESEAGMIGLVTSDNPEVVDMIQKHAQKTIEEYKEWQAEENSQDHAGHDHKDHG